VRDPLHAAAPEGAPASLDLIDRVRDRPAAEGFEPLLIDIKELARLLGISRATAERMKAAGRLPSPIILSAGCHRWRLEEIRDFVKAGCPPRREFEARQQARRG
jgi:predicted DNA-binding transcriptional regulator AlpA